MTLVTAVLFAALSATPLGFPDGLAHLEANVANPEQFASDVRAYHTMELGAIALLQAELASRETPPTPERVQAIREDIAQRVSRLRNVYVTALNQHPENARLRNYYGELLYDTLGEYAGALKEWNLALTYDEDCHQAMNNLSLHYFHEGRYDIGLQYLDEALKRDKKNPDYLYNMVQMYMVHFPEVERLRKWKRSKVYKEAMKLSEQAVKYAPEDFDIVQDHAMNFYAAENFGVDPDWEDAAEAWEAARARAQKQPELFNCWLNEGRVRLRGEDYAEAVRCLEEALKLNPESEVCQELLGTAKGLLESGGEKGKKSPK